MGREGQRLEEANSAAVDVATTTPAMQALIEASTAASEAQTMENDPPHDVAVETSTEASETASMTVGRNDGSTSSTTTTTTAQAVLVGPSMAEKSSKTNNHIIQAVYALDICLANLDPNEHARVSDPIVRPAKKNTNGKSKHKANGSDSDGEISSSNQCNGSENTAVKTSIGFSESILSRLFEPDRKQKPKLWEFIRLVAPGPAKCPPAGQYKWRSKDAIAAYCLKCKISFTYTPGTSKTVSRHLIAYHGFGGRNLATTKKAGSTQRKSAKPKASTKTCVSNTKALVETGDRKNTDGINYPKDDLSLATRKRFRPFVIAPEAGKIGTATTITVPNEESSIDRGDKSTTHSGSLSSFKKRKVHRLPLSEEALTKKGRNATEVPKGRRPPEESREDTAGRDEEVMDLLTIDDDYDENGEIAFLKGHGRNRKALITKALFRWWVGSYQSLDCYDSTIQLKKGPTKDIFGGRSSSLSHFLGFCKTLDGSFELPDPSVMNSMANASHERLQTEIKIHVSKLFPSDTCKSDKSHEFVSASVRRIKVVRIWDSQFEKGIVNNSVGNKDDTKICNASLLRGTGKGDREKKGTKHNNHFRNKEALGGEKFNTSQNLEIQERIFYPVRLTFCTPMFRMKSYVIAVIPEEIEKENRHRDGNESDETILSPYSKAVDRALQQYGFPRDNISRVVIRGSYEEVEEGASMSLTSEECFCILDRLDGIFAKALRSPAILPVWIQQLLRREDFHREDEGHKSMQKSTHSIFFTIRAHKVLLASLLPNEETENPQSNDIADAFDATVHDNVIADILDIITPFRDAIQTLSEDSYSTVGLAIPVLRRVKNILLHQRAKSLEDPQNSTEDRPEDDGKNVGNARKDNLESFHRSMLEEFEKNFDSVLKENSELMWTVPLDPRLIAMRGLSEMEQTEAKSMLVTKVAKIVGIVDRKEREQKDKRAPGSIDIPASKTNRNRYSLASTMGGIFWGDESDPIASSGTDSNQSFSTFKNAKQYAQKNVDSYFNTIHSQRQIRDPLLWWKNNQDQFPELAILARKWISASAVYGRKNTRANESVSLIPTSFSDTESICRMIFLHDNNDIV